MRFCKFKFYKSYYQFGCEISNLDLFFRYSRPNGEQIDEFEIEDDTHQTIGRCRCLESHNPTEEAIATSGHLAVERGEELVVIQSDFGSGWTYVQGVHGVGFVPTKILYFV